MEALSEIKARLLDGMREFMADGDVEYEESHIRECAAVLDRYAAAISTAEDRHAALGHVREAVLALNDLNLRAGAARGLFDADEDVTEEWREW